jgi:nucleotide-binding universal stress UspA family protein
MFKTIVWATDGSELADRARSLVTELAGVHGAKIVAVHANEIVSGRLSGAPLLADQEALQTQIEGQVAELRKAGLTAEFTVVGRARTAVAELIVEAATAVAADLIVVGTHGRGVAAGAILGSVANDLLRLSECPVLVVPAVRGPAAVSVG